ncbi:MAG: GDYXXLXY domain-containing protein, partial [Hyphomicrobiaceae bacterium]|nr:GDYXXLXY domain-containing protein [Hyphomicrobiaceae bacterium]
MKNPKLMALVENARRNASDNGGAPRPARRVALPVRKAPDGPPTSQSATTVVQAEDPAATKATSSAVSSVSTPATPAPPGSSGSSPPSATADNPPDQPTKRWLAIGLLVLLKATLLIGIIASRMIHLATGTEVVLNVTPVDPRSLFRGDYVIIST